MDGQAEVHEGVVEHLAEVRRVAVERVGVEEQDGDAEVLGRAQERREVQRVGGEEVEVRVAVAGVDLERQPELQRGVGEPAADRPVGHPVGVGVAQSGGDGVPVRLLGGEVQADPVCGDALGGDGAAGAEPVLDRAGDVVEALLERLLGQPFEADDLVRVAAGQSGQLGRGGEGRAVRGRRCRCRRGRSRCPRRTRGAG